MAEENQGLTPDQLKDLMHVFAMLKANIENWKYVQHNASLLPRERLEQTIEQMISTFDPIIDGTQLALEVEALTKFDPIDLI